MSAKLTILLLIAVPLTAEAGPVLFDFENAPPQTSLPISLTVGEVKADFSATGQGFSIQLPSNSIGMTPAGFSGYCISPNSVFRADLLVSFPKTPLTNFSILYAPQELDTDSSATMRVTAYMNGKFVGSNTAVASPPGTWPSNTLSFGAATVFNSVVIHYDLPPPTGGDYGVIFVADNMVVTAATPGDANLDGLVDGADYTRWADHFLQTGRNWATGDFSNDGLVDGVDYTIWADHFAPAPPLQAFSVPEPTTLTLASIAATALFAGALFRQVAANGCDRAGAAHSMRQWTNRHSRPSTRVDSPCTKSIDPPAMGSKKVSPLIARLSN